IIEHVEFPHFVRVDTWVSDRTHVSTYYDSLLAKVIGHAPDRQAVVRLVARALRDLWIDGVADNVDLLLATLEEPAFLNGDSQTGFLVERGLVDALAETPSEALAAASALDFLRLRLQPASSGDPWQAAAAWRIGRVEQPAAWNRAGRTHRTTVSSDLGGDGA